MRICYFADGRSIHFHRWIRFFANAGHEMYFVSYQPVTEEQVQAIEAAGAKHLGSVGPFHLKRFWITRRDLRWLQDTLKHEGIDVLHCHFLGTNAWYAALTGHHPLVLTVMGGGDVCGPSWRPQGRAARTFTPLALRRADLVTSWSPLMKDVVRPYCRPDTPIEVLHGGVDLRIFHPGDKPDYLYKRWNIPASAPVIFSPRLMRPLSNLRQLAEAGLQVCAALSDAYVVFAYPAQASEPQYERELREVIAGSGAADRFRFIGSIPHQEMADHYRLATVTVSIPSTDGTPMSALESMACGTSVIVADIPDYDRFYFDPGQTVLTVPVGDSNALAEAILKILREPQFVLKLTTEARRRVEAAGSYEAQMSAMNELYRQLGVPEKLSERSL